MCFLFVPSNIKLESAFIVTLFTLVFDSFMLTLLVLNQMNLLSCLVVTLITLIGHAQSVDEIFVPMKK